MASCRTTLLSRASVLTWLCGDPVTLSIKRPMPTVPHEVVWLPDDFFCRVFISAEMRDEWARLYHYYRLCNVMTGPHSTGYITARLDQYGPHRAEAWQAKPLKAARRFRK